MGLLHRRFLVNEQLIGMLESYYGRKMHSLPLWVLQELMDKMDNDLRIRTLYEKTFPNKARQK